MNFLEMQRQMIEEGQLSEDEINRYAGQNVILNFRDSEIGPRSSFDGATVFPRADSGITAGTWVCELERDGPTYFAKPVRRVDASFFMELRRGQKDEIIDALWNDHREELDSEFKEFYSEVFADDIRKAVQEAVASKDEEIERLKEENADLRRMLEGNRMIAEANAERAQEPESMPVEDVIGPMIRVTRVSPDMLRSPFFTGHRYFVHVSYDLKTMVIRPHDYGTVICINNTLLISGLGTISSYTKETDLPSEYSPEKGLIVHL